MTDPIDTQDARAVHEAATAGEWLYRPQDYDDWGYVRAARNEEGWMPVIAVARGIMGDLKSEAEHRKAGTDPYGPNARAIAHYHNTYGPMLDELDTLRARVAALEKLVARSERRERNSTTFWMIAANEALTGNTTRLRNRVAMHNADPLALVASGDAALAAGATTDD